MPSNFKCPHTGTLLIAAGTLVAAMLVGCATYQPLPLPFHNDLAPSVDRLKSPGGNPPAAPKNALNLTQLAVLAVTNNPDLKARRKVLGIKRAELFAAGLLPDPQLSASLDYPTGNTAGTVNAFGLGLGYDIIPLITRRPTMESARAARAQSRLEVLWQEWQVSQQARSLAVRLNGERRQMTLLKQMRDLYRQRYQRARQAVARGDITLGVAGTDLTALLDTLSQVGQLEQTVNMDRHDLNLLLGLAPNAPLAIHLGPQVSLPDKAALNRALQTLPQRRPDLLALKAGYRSQEAKVRAAILAQFPSLNIGITRARDTSDVSTSGFTIGLTLPLFSGNRGPIAVQRATREQLRAEYQARLDQAEVDVDKLMRLQNLVADRQKQLADYLPTLEDLVDRGRQAYRRSDIDALTFLNMESTWINKRLEQIDLEQTQRANRIALQTLLAMPSNAISRTADHSQGNKK
jgi:outer membrane protein, heavy metal efflux system